MFWRQTCPSQSSNCSKLYLKAHLQKTGPIEGIIMLTVKSFSTFTGPRKSGGLCKPLLQLQGVWVHCDLLDRDRGRKGMIQVLTCSTPLSYLLTPSEALHPSMLYGRSPLFFHIEKAFLFVFSVKSLSLCRWLLSLHRAVEGISKTLILVGLGNWLGRCWSELRNIWPLFFLLHVLTHRLCHHCVGSQKKEWVLCL